MQNITQGASESSPPLRTSSADSVPTAKVDTPLEAKKALEGLEIWDYCSPPYHAYDNREDQTGVFCLVPTAKPNDIALGVLFVFANAEWWELRMAACAGRPSEEVIVTDAKTFIVFAFDDLSRQGKWPVEVSPIDIQKALGGQVMTIGDCNKLPAIPE